MEASSCHQELAAAETGELFPGWINAVAASLDLSQQDSEDTEVADACRVDSSSECDPHDDVVSSSASPSLPSPIAATIPVSAQASDDSYLRHL